MDGSTPSQIAANDGRAARRAPTLVYFGLVAAILLGAVWLIFSTIEIERSQRAQAQRTDDALVAIRDVTRAVLNAETGQRGFLITRDERYLDAYRLGTQLYPDAIGRLDRSIDEHSGQEQRALVQQMRLLADGKFSEMAESISLTRQGRTIDAQTLILTDEGMLAMDRLREVAGRLEVIERGQLDAASERSRAAEGRVIPLLALLLVAMMAALALGWMQIQRTALVEAQAARAGELSDARDRADLLAKELNHRVKNLFAVILAIVRLTGRGQPEARPVINKIIERIEALVAAHEITQGAPGQQTVDLYELVATAIRPYCSDREHCEFDGPPVNLPAKRAVPLGLVIHELVTNAVKYGAWSHDGGVVRAHWTLEDGEVAFHWSEEAQRAIDRPGEHEGFGSMLISSSAQQLGGTIERQFGERGLALWIRFPQEG